MLITNTDLLNFVTVLDDETGGHLSDVVKSWPFGLEDKTLSAYRVYHYPGKAEDLTQR